MRFKNRGEAGTQPAQRLAPYKGQHPPLEMRVNGCNAANVLASPVMMALDNVLG